MRAPLCSSTPELHSIFLEQVGVLMIKFFRHSWTLSPTHFQKNSELNCRGCNVAFLDFVGLFRDKLLGQTGYGVALCCIEFQRQAATGFVHAALIPGVALVAKALKPEIRIFDVEVFDRLLPSSHG
jgi:hypothetical protein